jgi:hypothetical protein
MSSRNNLTKILARARQSIHDKEKARKAKIMASKAFKMFRLQRAIQEATK